MMSDPWLTWRKQKVMASPKRYPFANRRQLLNSYRFEWIGWFLIGGGLSWPIACMVGKRA